MLSSKANIQDMEKSFNITIGHLANDNEKFQGQNSIQVYNMPVRLSKILNV